MAHTDKPHWLLAAPYASYADYLKRRGGSAVEQARARPPEDIVAELERSGLRGRGGAGFPTGTKWRTTMSHECPTRYVVCNAAEGEPGTFKDRYLLRRDPYSMLEGLLIAAHVAGAEEAYVAMKASFTKELARVRAAIEEMSAAGALEDVKVQVVEGPEEYLFGEERALLEVVEGNDPLPREPHYPPYERGLFATATSPNPAIVNNVETYARVPDIVRHGAASFREIGTDNTPGPLLFTMSGAVAKPGVYERAAGISLRSLIFEVAGGLGQGRSVKAVLCGVSAAVIGPDKLDTPADHAHMQLIGSGLGSAGFIVLDDRASMVRVAQSVARFLYVESCNQCAACKHGLRTASSAIDELFDAKSATPDDAERALYGARSAPQGNRCYLPVQGSILIPGILRRFSAEFDAQLAAPEGGGAPYLIPKMIDFDEATRTFAYDELQPRKRPNWTYEEAPVEPPPVSVPKPIKAAKPAEAKAVVRTQTVRLAPDVREALGRVVRDEGEVDKVVNAALRQWLQDRGD
jgi:NADH-quinone oxidoreductase subunit F